MTSRAITRYVVYLPPPIRTTPLASTVTRCSRDALTVDPSDGATSGRRPAYVPTTSARVRSDVHRRVDRVEQAVHLPARRRRPRRRPLERRVGRADQPEMGPRDEEDDLARDADGQAHRVRDALARHDEVGATGRQDPHRRALERVVGFGCPDAGGVDDGAGRDVEVGAGREILGSERGDRTALSGSEARRTDPGDRHGRRRRSRSEPRPACSARRPRCRRGRRARRGARRAGGSVPARASRPSTGADASRRRGARRARRTASGRRRRTPSRRRGCRRSGTAAARSGRGVAPASGVGAAPRAPRARART